MDSYTPNVTQHIEALGGWVSVGYIGVVTSSLLLCLYMYNVFIFIKKNPSWARRHQAWITSLPMAISFISLASFFVPRATIMCETIKFIYMSFIMVQFFETVIVIGGGEEVLLRVQNGNKWYVITFSLFCKQLQFIQFNITKNRLRIIGGLIYQAFVSQLILTFIVAILEIAEVLRRDTGDAIFRFFLILNVLSSTLGLVFFNALNVGLSAHLNSNWPKFTKKYYALFYFICVQRAHSLFISVFNLFNVESPILTWTTIDAAASMLEAFIFGIVFFLFFKVVVVKLD
ncbi:uncharacterized protein LOC124312440 [Daphnia pulicaria]|uniref:uncharacterized protein LOC124312440 n=1 Tax=Daphnia pulicaria TaxID=35523 RepID=UPI001EEB63B1|nr:uncharacterized protein LOC124312440 [Daphnia pulicaria]